MIRQRKRVNTVSKTMRLRLAEYAKLKPAWRQAHKWCEYPGCSQASDVSPHHLRGRGRLLCDMRFWKALCREHHRFVHDNIEEARQLGLLCERGKWGSAIP